MSTIDHAARALELLDAAAELAASIESDLRATPAIDSLEAIQRREETARFRLKNLGQMHAAADVHATLALVQQQRAASIIAAYTPVSIGGVALAAMDAIPSGAYSEAVLRALT